ncbi:hypothetical protein [Arsenophonus symbiont of Ornithomya chloropus]
MDIQPTEIKNINEIYISDFYIIVNTIKNNFSNQDKKIAVIYKHDIFGK